MVEREPVDRRARLVDPDLLDREDRVEQRREPGGLGGGGEHARRAVREDRELEARLPERLERRARLGVRAEPLVQRHEAGAERRVGDAERLHREVERVRRHVPEVGVPAHEAPEPGVLELLRAPELGERLPLRPERLLRALRGARDVEQRAIRVEHDRADALDGGTGVGAWWSCHADLPTSIMLQPRAAVRASPHAGRAVPRRYSAATACASRSRTCSAMGRSAGTVAAMVWSGSTAFTVVRPSSPSQTATLHGSIAPTPSSAVSASSAYAGLQAPRIW